MSTHKAEKEWDLVIKPQSALFDLHLQDLWKYRDLLILFVKRDFIAQYKQTILGPLWNIIQPIFTTIMFLLVFGKIANIPTDNIKPATLFYMSGITIWNYFSSCFTNTSNVFVANASIFGKVYFPRLILPLSTVISNIVRFFIQFGLLLLMMLYFEFTGYSFHIGWNWLLIPLLVLMMGGIGLGLGIIISSLTTKYRDFTVLIGFGIQLLMYATPIAYPLSYVKGKSYGWIIVINPLTPITEAFRFAIFGKGYFNMGTMGYSIIFMIVSLLVGIVIFNQTERSFMDTV